MRTESRKKSASLRVSVKAKYFLIKQNPFTKYKFCKKNAERARETEGKGQKRSAGQRCGSLHCPKGVTTQSVTSLCWNMLADSVLRAPGRFWTVPRTLPGEGCAGGLQTGRAASQHMGDKTKAALTSTPTERPVPAAPRRSQGAARRVFLPVQVGRREQTSTI